MFALLIVTSTLMFNRYLGLSLLDAVYFVVVTVATVGYGDINLLEASPPLKVFGIGMIMFGALTLALAFGLVTDAIVGARLLRALGQYPVPKRDHVVVCGAGTTGSTIIEALSEAGVRCVAVERDEDPLDAAFVKRLRLPSHRRHSPGRRSTVFDWDRRGRSWRLPKTTWPTSSARSWPRRGPQGCGWCCVFSTLTSPQGWSAAPASTSPAASPRSPPPPSSPPSSDVTARGRAPHWRRGPPDRRPDRRDGTDVGPLKRPCQARVIAVGSTPFPVPGLDDLSRRRDAGGWHQ